MTGGALSQRTSSRRRHSAGGSPSKDLTDKFIKCWNLSMKAKISDEFCGECHEKRTTPKSLTYCKCQAIV